MDTKCAPMTFTDLCNDILCKLLSCCDFTSFMFLSATCKKIDAMAEEYIESSQFTAQGYGLRGRLPSPSWRVDLVINFTCFCGDASWNVTAGCDCWGDCLVCGRILPIALRREGRYYPGRAKCKFGCRPFCYGCATWLTRAVAELALCINPVDDKRSSIDRGLASCVVCTKLNKWELKTKISHMAREYLMDNECEIFIDNADSPYYIFGYLAPTREFFIEHDPLHPFIGLIDLVSAEITEF